MSKIEWTNLTWNPTTGCDKVSQGCKFCYAEVMHRRLMKMFPKKYTKPFLGNVEIHTSELTKPLTWNTPKMIFVDSMSDLFHEKVPFEFIAKVFIAMALCPHHTFQILTKRPERAVEFFKEYEYFGFGDDRTTDELAMDFHPWLYDKRTHELRADLRKAGWFWDRYNDDDSRFIFENDAPLKNVWIGTSVEDQKVFNERVPHLLNIPAHVRFLSCEPLLGPIDLSTVKPMRSLQSQFDWVIVGGESGNKKGVRPMHPDWVRSLRDQCKESEVKFFFKQKGAWEEIDIHRIDQPMSTVGYFDENQKFVECKNWKYLPMDIGRNPSDQRIPMTMVGKKSSGNFLDGVQHLEFPA